MKSLRFCMVTTFYPPFNFGGDGIGVQRLSRALARAGHEVTVVHDVDAFRALSGGEPDHEPEMEGIEVVPLRSDLGIISPLLTQQTGRPVVNRKRIRRLFEEGRFDVINFHNVSLVGGPGILSEGDAVKLYTAHEHWLVCPMHVLWRHKRELCTGRECLRCTLHYRRPPQLWRNTGYLEGQLAHVDAFIAKSRFSRDKHKEFGFSRDMEVMPYFLPERAASDAPSGGPSPHTRPFFLFVGRLESIKGLQDVIPAFKDYGDADLLIAGDGEYSDELRALAHGIEGVRFLGRIAPGELRRYYEHALALIVPSICYETFGIILIEAFREGTPVVARRIGPFPEILEQCPAGALFSSQEELLSALHRLQSDAETRAALGRTAREGFETHWSEGAVLPQYLEIVRSAAERAGKPDVAAALAPEPELSREHIS
jgi:glycosyltransferase involved in cell wall biosynthesis